MEVWHFGTVHDEGTTGFSILIDRLRDDRNGVATTGATNPEHDLLRH